ncbi:hypothetical protein DKL61_09685 [Gammaproteobacteria bacterium ESL0073]|nr:hypothetical protein DKL61_09685 [Gammaproteobacteria bacterium ESL0073]
MAKFYKHNDQMDAQVGWRIADPNRIAWRKKGLQCAGKSLVQRKFMFFMMTAPIILLLFILGVMIPRDIVPIICVGVIMLPFFFYLIYLGMLGGDVFTYRLTDTSVEEASWNDYIPFAKKLFQVPLCIIAIAIVFMVATKPEIIFGVGLGGMVGVGLLAGATLYSSDYEKDNLNYRYVSTDWSLMAHHVEIDKERRVVIFWAADLNTKKQYITPFCLFCTKDNFEQISKFVINKAQAKQLEIKYKTVFLEG